MDFSSKSLLPPIFNRAKFSPPSLGDFRSKFCSLFKALRLGLVWCWTPSICVKSLPTGSAQCVAALGPCHTAGVSNSSCFSMFPFNKIPLERVLHCKTSTTTAGQNLLSSCCALQGAGGISSSTLRCFPPFWGPVCCWLPETTINHCNTKCQGTHF